MIVLYDIYNVRWYIHTQTPYTVGYNVTLQNGIWYIHTQTHTQWSYGVATMSRPLQIIGLFCRILFLFKGSFAKETYDFKEPTDRSHPIRAMRNVNGAIMSARTRCSRVQQLREVHLYSALCVYVHIHIYICTYTYIFTFTYVYVHIHIYIYVHIHIYMYVYIHICTYTYTYVHIHIYIYMWMCLVHLYALIYSTYSVSCNITWHNVTWYAMLYTYTNTYTVWLRATCKGSAAILSVRTLRSECGSWKKWSLLFFILWCNSIRIEYCYIIEHYIIIYTYTYTYRILHNIYIRIHIWGGYDE